MVTVLGHVIIVIFQKKQVLLWVPHGSGDDWPRCWLAMASGSRGSSNLPNEKGGSSAFIHCDSME